MTRDALGELEHHVLLALLRMRPFCVVARHVVWWILPALAFPAEKRLCPPSEASSVGDSLSGG